jgi:hypothetical protein
MTVTVDEHWTLDFVTEHGASGFVRLARVGERCWYWCYLVGDDVGLVAVRDHDVPPPRRRAVLEVRADSLWAELVCETAGEHWGVALEAFGLRLDAAVDAWEGEIGERLPVGLDLEWEVDATGDPHGSVRGEALLGRARHEVDGWGVLTHSVAPATAWPDEWSGRCRFPDGTWARVTAATTGAGEGGIAVPVEATLDDGRNARCEPLAVVPVPLGSGPALVRVLTGVVPSGAGAAMTGIGWLEMLQSERPGRNEEP